MKNITIMGGIGKDPVTRTTKSGDSVTSFSVAVDDGFGDNRRTLWFDCSIWGKRGEAIAQYCKKGDRICITGDLSTREYEGKTYLTIKANDFSFAGKSGGGQSQGGNPQGGAGYPEDEIPF